MVTTDRNPRLLGVAASVVGLTSFVVAQPLLAVLGEGATFFVAHGATGADVVAFTALVVLAPALVVGAVLLLAYGIAPRAFPPVLATTVGTLVAAFVVPAIDRAVGLTVPVFVIGAALVTVGAATLYRRVAVARTYVAATALAPIVVVGLFLFASPASSLIGSAGAVGATASSDVDVVVLIFDELPLVGLLDEDGGIDSVRYPNLGRLASMSTWYSQTTTISGSTTVAVPAMLAGVEPTDRRTLPVAAEYPRNVMSMLEDSHEIHSHEAITYLCGTACDDDRFRSRRLLARDASTLYLHTLLPDGLAERWLPELGSRWAGFVDGAGDDALRADMTAEFGLDQGHRADALIELLEAPTDRPSVVIGHLLLPHTPYTRLPDGRTYQPPATPHGLVDDGRWSTPESAEVARQLLALQTQYVDTIIGRVLDALEERGTVDDTLLIVAADHGVVLQDGAQARSSILTEANLAELAVVPLLVHYPGQTEGAVDTAPRQIIDVAPTIADVLDVDLDGGWRFDGVSLLEPDPRLERTWAGPDPEVGLPLVLDLSEAIDRHTRLLGSGRPVHDVYAWGPHRDLVGQPIEPHVAPDGEPGPAATVADQGLELLGPQRASLPAVVEVVFAEDADAEWVAVSLNGRIAGLGLVHVVDGRTMTRVVVDPALVAETNEVGIWAATPDGLVEVRREG